MKKFMVFALFVGAMSLGFTSCGDDDENTCVTCAEYSAAGVTIPASEVCEDADGNAVVDGTSVGVPYSTYIQTQNFLTNCE